MRRFLRVIYAYTKSDYELHDSNERNIIWRRDPFIKFLGYKKKCQQILKPGDEIGKGDIKYKTDDYGRVWALSKTGNVMAH